MKFLGIRTRKVIRKLKGEGPAARVAVLDQFRNEGEHQLIPRTVYQSAESPYVHPRHFRSLEQFRKKNLDLDFIFYSAEQRDAYMKDAWSNHPIWDIYRRAKFGQMKADIFRYCIVFDRGGYWVDFNKGFNCSITSLHSPETKGFISSETTESLIFPEAAVASVLANPACLIVQWAFGFIEKHPILERAIDRIVEIEPFFRGRQFASPKNALLTMTATGLFTWAVRSFVEEQGMNDLSQVGTDFNGHGVFRLEGWNLSIDRRSHYAKMRDLPII